MTLPPTYEVPGEITLATSQAIAFGGFCDVYQGTVGSENVCIKRLRINATGDQALVKQVSNP